MNKLANPVVSVVMSVHNDERYIEDAINSILNQSLIEFEFIVIDDGSTDQTGEILKRFQDSRLKVIKQENRGLTKALNYGISVSQCALIARMDADDMCHPNRLLRQYEEMQRRPNLALLGTNTLQVDYAGKAMGEYTVPVGVENVKSRIFEANPFVHGSIMMRHQAFQEISGYRNEFRFAQDYDLALRLSEHYEIDNLPEYLYTSRLNLEMISVSNKDAQAAFAALARILFLQRQTQKPDALDSGTPIEQLLPTIPSTDEGETKYYHYLLSANCRKGEVKEARSTVIKLLKKKPFNLKLWLIGIATILGPRGMKLLCKAWDNQLTAE